MPWGWTFAGKSPGSEPQRRPVNRKGLCMKKINPQWVQWMQSTVNPCPYFSLLKMKVTDLSWGVSRVEIQVEKRHLQPFGLVHGGVYASLLDAAGFWAVFSQIEPDAGLTTVDLAVNYLAPAASGALLGFGKCLKVGKSLGLAEARVEDENGRLLAYGKTTVMVRADLGLAGQKNSVAKFLT